LSVARGRDNLFLRYNGAFANLETSEV
jgi:hypothetical protein